MSEENIVLTIKLPVRVSVLGWLVEGLEKQFGDGLTMQQAGDNLEFIAPDPYQMNDDDQEKTEDSPETDDPI